MAPHETQFHPQFRSSDADCVLSSSDSPPVLFRVPAFTLRITCRFFREIFANEDSKTVGDDTNPYETKKPARLLLPFLQMISGLPVSLVTFTYNHSSTPSAPDLSSSPPPDLQLSGGSNNTTSLPQVYTHLCSLLKLTAFYGAPGPISQIRAAMKSPLFLRDPIRLYVIACTYGWEEERQWAISAIVSGYGGCGIVWAMIEAGMGDSTYDTPSPESLADEESDVLPKPRTHTQLLLGLTPGIHLIRILILQRRRTEAFRKALEVHKYFIESGMNEKTFSCPACASRAESENAARTTHEASNNAPLPPGSDDQSINQPSTATSASTNNNAIQSNVVPQTNWEWRDLKHAMVVDLEKRSDGGGGLVGIVEFDMFKGLYGTLLSSPTFSSEPLFSSVSDSPPPPSSPLPSLTTMNHLNGPVGVAASYLQSLISTRPGTVEEWMEGKTCFDAKCARPGCGWIKYDKPKVLQAIGDCLKSLPKSL